jgi:hypothetical protein
MNTSNVPGTLVSAERKLGFDSMLVTLYKDPRGYTQDICLNLPFINFSGTKWIKKRVSNPEKISIQNVLKIPNQIPPIWTPHTRSEKILVNFRDFIWKFKIEPAIRRYKLDQYDVLHLDGGLSFYRNASFIKSEKVKGKYLICCYTGSDLRTRGVIPKVDRMSDLNVSVEFDHLYLHPSIHHVFFPFDASSFKRRIPVERDYLRIGHAPTNRQAKGSDIIIPVLHRLKEEYPIEIVLIENLPHQKAIQLKATCDIFIDQIGDLGYGINSLESLAMGIATCSCLAPGFEEKYPDHPFIHINSDNIKNQLIKLILDFDWRVHKAEHGYRWVREQHCALETVKKIHKLAGI